MNFSSKQDMVRCFCRELLDDGEPHSIQEISAYIKARAYDLGLLDQQISHSTIWNTLHITSPGYQCCQLVGNKMYQKYEPTALDCAAEDVSLARVYARTRQVLESIMEPIRKCFEIDLSETSLSDEELLAMSAAGRKVLSLLSQAQEIVAEAPTMEQSEDASMEQEEDCFGMTMSM